MAKASRKRGNTALMSKRVDGPKFGSMATPKESERDRDENLRRVRKVGRKAWKQESNYHRRSLAETTMLRFKTIFLGSLRSRDFDNLEIQVQICPFLDSCNKAVS